MVKRAATSLPWFSVTQAPRSDCLKLVRSHGLDSLESKSYPVAAPSQIAPHLQIVPISIPGDVSGDIDYLVNS